MRNHTWVSEPFGFTVPYVVAPLFVIPDAEPVVTVGGVEGWVVVK